MEKQNALARIRQLREELQAHNYRYYQLASPVISDYEFDQLLKELEALEKEFPEFLSPNSPTQRVGGEITREFLSVKHKYPMYATGQSCFERPHFQSAGPVRLCLLEPAGRGSATGRGGFADLCTGLA